MAGQGNTQRRCSHADGGQAAGRYPFYHGEVQRRRAFRKEHLARTRAGGTVGLTGSLRPEKWWGKVALCDKPHHVVLKVIGEISPFHSLTDERGFNILRFGSLLNFRNLTGSEVIHAIVVETRP